MKIFITGGTGFLGQYLVRELSARFDEIYVLSRKSTFKGFDDLKNVKIIKGDISYPQMIEGSDQHKFIFENIDIVIHAAALYDVQASYSESYMQNIIGTQNTIRLARKIKNLRAFYYVSTLAIAEEESFYLAEDEFPDRKKFSDHYSETKYHAEKLVRDMGDKMNVRIIRPGIIVGDSRTGHYSKVDGPYYFMNSLKEKAPLLKLMPFIPLSYNPLTKIPLIPVDQCARYFCDIISRDTFLPEMSTFHLVGHELPTIREFLRDLNHVLGIRSSYFPVLRNPIHDMLLSLMGVPKELMPFMFSRITYDKTNVLKVVPEIAECQYSLYKDKIFSYLKDVSQIN